MARTVMGFIDSDDQRRITELESQGYKIVMVQPGPDMTTKVLLARQYEDDRAAEDASYQTSEMVMTTNPPYYLALTTPSIPPLDAMAGLTKTERKKYMRTVTAMARVLEFHGWAWLALAVVGTGALVGTLITALCILDDAVEEAGVLDGWELVTLTFVMAIFVISPAVLLILGRPLANLERWMPAGGTPERQDGDDTDTAK